MNTEGRLTRNRARVTGTPLLKALDSDVRRTGRATKKEGETPLPRVALFDRTNDAATNVLKINVEVADKLSETVNFQSDDDTCASEGTVVITNEGVESNSAQIPIQDNMVKQMLDEYESLQINLTAEMHTTPLMRSQTAPTAAEEASAGKVEMAENTVGQQKSIQEEMLITPIRVENAPVQASSDLTVDTTAAPEAAPVDGAAEFAGKVAVKTEAITAAPEKVDTDRWEMDGSPYPSGKVQMAKPDGTRISQYPKSAVKPTTPYDPRSLRQIRQELKEAAAEPKGPAGLLCDSKSSDMTDYTGAVCAAEAGESEEASSELCKALGDMQIASKGPAKEPLRGLPVAAGRHTRFTEEGEPVDSPSTGRTLLRGFPAPAGAHLRFED